jgi:NAD(P)-dependent dehydrogenase (short-subunit alcohol dehydrogenase family)
VSLLGKRVVVLGGTSGIGFAVASAAARAGAEAVVASSSKERVASAVARLGGSAAGHVVDVLDQEGVRGFFAEVGAFDHLVYTAGDRPRLAPVAGAALADVRTALDVRVWGCYNAVHEALPALRPGGSIVLSSGGAAVRPSPGWALAAAATGAVEAFARALAVELAPIRVNVVRPGVVRTELWDIVPEQQREQLLAEHAAKLPVRHIPQPEAAAKAYLYALDAEYCTGSVIEIDGGASLV